MHQCARYTFFPKEIHDKALNIIDFFLKKIRLKEVVFCPITSLNIDCYIYAYFDGLWGYDIYQDPNCSRKCTGCVMTVAYDGVQINISTFYARSII